MGEAVLLEALRAECDACRRRLEENFRTHGDAGAALTGRAALADRTISALVSTLFASAPAPGSRCCLLAIGGYGRRALFPSSDLDVLLLCADAQAAEAVREPAAALVRMLWDLGWRAAVTSRLLEECDRFEQENPEFSISLLDNRPITGDPALGAILRQKILPALAAREHSAYIRSLDEMTRERHQKHGNTLFHLEPNLKDAPGGLRDFDVACWATAIQELARLGTPDHKRAWTAPDAGWGQLLGDAAGAAYRFIAAVRVFLHYHHGRDDNRLTYDLQEEAASRNIGVAGAEPLRVEEWMRLYFRHARTIARISKRRMDEAMARPSLYSAFEDWRARLSNADFSVHRNRVFCRRPAALADPVFLLSLFEFAARHGLELAVETETIVEQALPTSNCSAGWPGEGAAAGAALRRILNLPSAGLALRAMHRVGVLDAVLPEFRAVDALVIRDLYHRYTVDEHTLLTIEGLHALRHAASEPDRRFAEILAEVEQPELLYLALLLHDVGKGMPGGNHVVASLEAAERACPRLGLAPYERDLVAFLIRNHLEMSLTLQRRDIFDPEAVRVFAEQVATPERLKMLCLLTYADICAVNPEAMTPWKAELLWQLYAATTNYLTRSVDDERVRLAETSSAEVEKLVGALGTSVHVKELHRFLEGLPQRYTATHSPEQIAAHFELVRRLPGEPMVVDLQPRDNHFDLTVVTADRPYLFASITGTLAAWGMSIVKADAFANAAGTILDAFTFVDLHRTLELNPSEGERFKRDLVDVLNGTAKLKKLMSGRVRAGAALPPKVEVTTRVRFDGQSSSHSTLLELVAQDRPGLLFDVSSVLADEGCNIEVALIDTEGQRAIDVFYLTSRGAKLSPRKQAAVGNALEKKLRSK